jgi:hypothetical protein
VLLKGPNGAEQSLDVQSSESVSQMRVRAAALFSLSGEEIHLVVRGKILKDEDAVSSLAMGDVLRIARRAVQASSSTTSAAVAPATDDRMSHGGTGAPMPNAFGTAPMDLQTLLAGAGNGGADLNPAALEALQRQLAAAARRQEAAQLPLEVRLPREVRLMGHQVRLRVAERQGVDPENIEEDPSLMDHIARTMAEARARGAPVPNIDFFVNHTLSRAEQARALNTRLNREADGLDPELEDALIAAEQVTAAAARAPRRLGGGGNSNAGS